MSGNNTEIAANEIDSIEEGDLDAFNDLFHKGETLKEEVEEKIDDAPTAIEEDTDLANTDEDEDDEPELSLEEEQPKPKKNRTQERIEQLLQKEREANERANALEARLKQLEEKGQVPTNIPTPTKKEEDSQAPHWEDKNEDGTDKYPLGQFDPAFAADYIKYNVAQELSVAKEAEAKARADAEIKAQQDELTENWNEKLEPAKERYPDFLEKGDNLVDTFAGIDQAYGEYLTSTLMSMEYGPDVLYYLANNIDEAQRIVNLGPAAATVALGRLEAQFINDDSTNKPRPKVSKAPAPPPTNKGSAVAVAEIADDTDDLDAFSAKMFKGR